MDRKLYGPVHRQQPLQNNRRFTQQQHKYACFCMRLYASAGKRRSIDSNVRSSCNSMCMYVFACILYVCVCVSMASHTIRRNTSTKTARLVSGIIFIIYMPVSFSHSPSAHNWNDTLTAIINYACKVTHARARTAAQIMLSPSLSKAPATNKNCVAFECRTPHYQQKHISFARAFLIIAIVWPLERSHGKSRASGGQCAVRAHM